MIDDGLTLKEISIKVNFSVQTIKKVVDISKLIGNDRVRKITDEQLLKEKSDGLTYRDIALKYKMSYKTVWKRFNKINGTKTFC